MKNPLLGARLEVLAIVQDLRAIKFRLLGVQSSLPASIAETDPLLETEEADEATSLRTTIACVLTDFLAPAAEALDAVSAKKKEREGEG
ncbi:MAG TPA: hypothetical protein VMW27_00840 [Thermoanaerobaculia bacterium]|nr:hypothetical protein [Thermoanaerobaculia bacterium]